MSETNGKHYTNIQLKMLKVLSDGLAHTRQELHACLADDMGPLSNIRAHITGMRKLLRPKGEEIICEFRGRTTHYRHVRLLRND